MQNTVYDRLLCRELGTRSTYSSVKGIYGDRKWIRDLDIVNELDGHHGCVNALSWSKSGRLLASGSDDTNILIHAYQPEDSTAPFKLLTSLSTGHSANIFSVKYMPHSGDRTIVSAAGDSQIRVFDIEHSGRSTFSPNEAASRRSQGLLRSGTQFLSEADTNTRVYRSHSDRVKRIVTESSPFLFLSCSEDGEVRQWDLRQPSAAYPKPRSTASWRSSEAEDDTGVPPPLISYKRWNLDLNSISCSPSQPHYIALGGAHLHCFLHDRRMLGRDNRIERPASASSKGLSDHDDDLMCEATRCVKRFAPNGQQRMRRTDNGHITACKISDANPNEMVVSWSGEWIYNFDLLRTPDARDPDSGRASTGERTGSQRNKESHDRKRKRTRPGTSPSSREAMARASSRPRTESHEQIENEQELSLRVHYENGQSENIRIQDAPAVSAPPVTTSEELLIEAHVQSRRIADKSVEIREAMFTLENPKPSTPQDPTGHATSFTQCLGICASILDDMDDIMRQWRYPINPDEFEVAFQKTLRAHRDSARRFIQATGVVARVLGGKLNTASSSRSRMLDNFAQITPSPNELSMENPAELFSYDFLKAICLWLDSGPGAVVEGFTRTPARHRNNDRFPIPEGASIEALDDYLIPYLLLLAGTRPIIDVNSSRFEVDASRHVFESERAAVLAFANALKIPFEDISGAIVLSPPSGFTSTHLERVIAQSRVTALKFWAFRTARGVLLHAGEGVNHQHIDRAFGGLGKVSAAVRRDERTLDERLRDVDVSEPDSYLDSNPQTHEHQDQATDGSDDNATDQEMAAAEDLLAEFQAAAEAVADSEDDEEDDDDEDEGEDSDDDSSEHDEEDEDEYGEGEEGVVRRLLNRSAFERAAMREKVKTSVPCVTHTRLYRGHCNVKTVKDVNFFGLNDEYVVSGSDSGHVFIWDRKTSELVNILEGDGEVVNVVQSHPYEPVLAVSGIDHTVKIFSPDKLARSNARKGIGVMAADPAGWSSINYVRRGGFGARRARQQQTPVDSNANNNSNTAEVDVDSEDTDTEPPPHAGGLASKRRVNQEYQITSQNDIDRQGGNQEAVISRAMLAQIAARMRAARNANGAPAATDGVAPTGGEVDPNGPIVLMGPNGPVMVQADNCSIM